MKQRVITAIIMISLLIPILIYGKLTFVILVIFLTLVATQEMIEMKEKSVKTPLEVKIFTMVATLMIVFSSFNLTTLSFTGTLSIGLGLVALFLFILLLAVVIHKEFKINDAGYYLLTIFYVGSTFHSMLFLRFLGLNLFLFMILVVAVTDSGAYFVGRKFGKRKLAPTISPNKTIEGAVGGIILGVLVGTIFGTMVDLSSNILMLIVMSLVVTLVAQFGDLVASSMKREYGIKDFGKLFPGHGGVLDRLDSHLYASLALYILINLMGMVI